MTFDLSLRLTGSSDGSAAWQLGSEPLVGQRQCVLRPLSVGAQPGLQEER